MTVVSSGWNLLHKASLNVTYKRKEKIRQPLFWRLDFVQSYENFQ